MYLLLVYYQLLPAKASELHDVSFGCGRHPNHRSEFENVAKLFICKKIKNKKIKKNKIS